MEVIENNSHLENAGKDQTEQKEILSEENIRSQEQSTNQHDFPAGTDMPTAPFEKSGGGKLPNLQTLKPEKEKLLAQKKEAQEKYYYYRDYQKELETVCANIHPALGQLHTRPIHRHEREDIS